MKPLRILIVEDNENDMYFMVNYLAKAGYGVQYARVESAGAMHSALDETEWDIVTCDCEMPDFSAESAIELLKNRDLDMPVIVISGRIGEEKAVALMKQGAKDVVMKSSMDRLPEIINRELQDLAIIRTNRELEGLSKKNLFRLQIIHDFVKQSISNTDDLLDMALEKAIELTDSTLGFLCFYDEISGLLTLHSWSREALNQCDIESRQIVYELEKTGLWGEVVRQKAPIIINDYKAAHPLKRGFPLGHAPISRFLSVPVLSNGVISAVVGLANKASDYTETDQIQLSLLMDAVWKMVEKQQHENELEKSYMRQEALLRLAQMNNCSRSELLAFVIDQACVLTGSPLAFIGLVDKEQPAIGVAAWSKSVFAECELVGQEKSFAIESGSAWEYVCNNKAPAIVNDYVNNPFVSMNLPATHISLRRFLAVPVTEGDSVMAVATVANKSEPYDQQDSVQLSLLMTGLWGHFHKMIQEQVFNDEREQLKVILDSITDGIILLDNNLVIRMHNPAAASICGKEGQNLTGCRVTEVDCLADLFHDTAYDLKQMCGIGEWTVAESGGGFRKFLEYKLSPVHHDQANVISYVLVFTDITEQKRQASQRIMAGKLEAIGQLAAGIAHEINTPMQYIGDNIIFMQEACAAIHSVLGVYRGLKGQVRESGMFAEELDRIEQCEMNDDIDFFLNEGSEALNQAIEGVSIVNDLVRGMREFSHPGTEGKDFHNLNEALDLTIKVTKNQWKYGAEVETEYDPNLPLVFCSIDQIHQVFLNLIVNSVHAIQEQVLAGVYSRGHILVHTSHSPTSVTIRVADNGSGIPDDIADRIFDPFFTTKDVGQGTGQGLAIVHDIIVNKHQGQIDFQSEKGRGTEFRISIPIRQE